ERSGCVARGPPLLVFVRPSAPLEVLAAVTTATTRSRRRLLLLRDLRDERFRREEQARHRRRVLQRRARHLGRVDDAGLEHVDVPLAVDIVAGELVLALVLLHLL